MREREREREGDRRGREREREGRERGREGERGMMSKTSSNDHLIGNDEKCKERERESE